MISVFCSNLFAVSLRFFKGDVLDIAVAGNVNNAVRYGGLLRHTDVLILDEPLANPDAATAVKIEDLLLSIKNKILLVVSHQFTPEKLAAFDSVINFNMTDS